MVEAQRMTPADFPVDGYYWIRYGGSGRVSIVEVRTGETSDGSTPKPTAQRFVVGTGGMAERWLNAWLRTVPLLRVKLIDPALDPFAGEYGLLIRRGGAAMLSGTIRVVNGEPTALAEMEMQANAAAGPLRIWVNDMATPDGRLGAQCGRIAVGVAEREAGDDCPTCKGTGSRKPLDMASEMRRLVMVLGEVGAVALVHNVARSLSTGDGGNEVNDRIATDMADAFDSMISLCVFYGPAKSATMFAEAQQEAARCHAAGQSVEYDGPTPDAPGVKRTGDAADATGEEFEDQ